MICSAALLIWGMWHSTIHCSTASIFHQTVLQILQVDVTCWFLYVSVHDNCFRICYKVSNNRCTIFCCYRYRKSLWAYDIFFKKCNFHHMTCKCNSKLPMAFLKFPIFFSKFLRSLPFGPLSSILSWVEPEGAHSEGTTLKGPLCRGHKEGATLQGPFVLYKVLQWRGTQKGPLRSGPPRSRPLKGTTQKEPLRRAPMWRPKGATQKEATLKGQIWRDNLKRPLRKGPLWRGHSVGATLKGPFALYKGLQWRGT